MTTKKRGTPHEPTNPYRDLPAQARLAAVDYLAELRRQDEGVRQVGTSKVPITDPFSIPPGVTTPEWNDTGVTTGVTRLKYAKGEAPAKAYVRSLGIDGKLASEVADEVGCSVQLVRKLQKDPDIKAPSLFVPYGKNKIYIYTPEDVEEIRGYWRHQRQPRVREP